MKRKIRPKTLLPLVLCQLVVAPCVDAATHNVSSLSDLHDLVGDLSSTIQPGDRVVLADGTYSTAGGGLLFRVDGTAADPIVIEAETVGGVTITGGSIIRFTRDCSHLVLRGFVFQGNASVELDRRSHHLRLTQNTFAQAIPTSQDKDYLIVRADDVEIDHNLFDYKDSGGAMLDLTENNTSGQVVQNVWVHHNHFRDNVVNTDPGQNDVDTMTVGRSSTEHSSGNNIIEYNLFERCNGGAEIISSKSSDNTYRYNTFKDCEGDFTTRHSHRCLIYGNYFINTQGMRIWGDDHRIDSNYFENGSGIRIGRGQGSNRNKPENVQIIFNTFKNCTPHYYQMVGSGNEAPDNITFSNNIIDDDSNDAVIGAVWGSYTNGNWGGNIFNGVVDDGPVPTSGYTVDDPELVSVDGIYHLSSSSPAINAATGTFNAVMTDIDGQNRPSATTNKDVGADEFSSSNVLNPLLTPADVGPSAAESPPGSDPGGALLQEAEDYLNQSGIVVEASSDEGGGDQVAYIQNGDWVSYANIDFGQDATALIPFSARVSSQNNGGVIEIRLDNLSSPPVGSLTVGAHGDWTDYRTVETTLSGISGEHTVFLTFSGGSGFLFNLNWFSWTPSTVSVPLEVLTVDWTSDIEEWITVDFASSYSDPIVIGSPVSYVGPGQCHVRVRNVTSTSFEYTLEEWDYMDGVHAADETVHFLVMEKGSYNLGGKNWEAGSISGVNHNWATVTLDSQFGGNQTVLTQVASFVGQSAVVTRLQNFSGKTFQVKVQEELGEDGWHSGETIHYMALWGGPASYGDLRFNSEKGDSTFTDATSAIDFGGTYNNPAFFAQVRSSNDDDPCGLRYTNLTPNGVDVFVEEEASTSNGVVHTPADVVNWLVVE